MHENSDFTMKINEINVELSEKFQRYINECCESESNGTIHGFDAGCCKRRGGGFAIAMGYCSLSRDTQNPEGTMPNINKIIHANSRV
jgi:hypothetical protein